MDRRLLLKLIAAASVTGCSGRDTRGQKFRVTVVGAGIVGASIAYHLAKSGASVTVIDKKGPASHASRGTFAWINASWAKQPRYYHELNQQSVANWRDLADTLGLPVRWGGSLEWFDNDDRQVRLAEQIREQAEWGEPARMVAAAELSKLEPNVDFADASRVAYSGNDGAVDPVAATRLLLSAAEEMGASVRYPLELTDISMRSGRLVAVETDAGPIPADRLVLATGASADAGKRFAHSDIPQRSTPGVIAITTPQERCIHHVIAAPGVHLHQRNDGRVVLGEQDGAPQNEAHTMRLKDRPNDFPVREIAEQHANRMLDIARRFAPCLAAAQLEDAYIGWRPLPLDGHPVLGPSAARPDIYLSVMHSGVTLAPVVGQLVAHELLRGEPLQRLDDFRPDRDFSLVKRY